jgi:hypothetical protein
MTPPRITGLRKDFRRADLAGAGRGNFWDSAYAGDIVRCLTKEDAPLKRRTTTCRDGSWTITRYDEALKRWQTGATRGADFFAG